MGDSALPDPPQHSGPSRREESTTNRLASSPSEIEYGPSGTAPGQSGTAPGQSGTVRRQSVFSRWWFPITASATVILAGWFSLTPEVKHAAVGKPGPELDLVELADGLSLTPIARPDGQVVLLHFWGTWCPPCQKEYPQLVELASKFEREKTFRFVPVSCEGQPDTFEGLWDKTSQYFVSQGLTSPAYADPRGVTRRSVAERLAQPSLYFPTSILIDARGKIAGVWEGYTPETVSQIEGAVRTLLKS